MSPKPDFSSIAVREPDVRLRMSILADRQNFLASRLDELAKRIDVVMVGRGESVDSKKNPTEQLPCEMSAYLQERIDDVFLATAKINSMLDRLEI